MKIIATIFLLIFALSVSAQDSTYVKRKLLETDINVLFSFYTQDGDHSAVTGGTGTENLQVYAPQLNVVHTIDSVHTLLFDAGIDFITSASTDNIDYNMSSASRKDAHLYASAGFSHYFRKPALELGFRGSFSMESDFLSGGFQLWFFHPDKSGMTTYYASLQVYFDDMRWGRLNPDYKRPVTLVYPIELRDTNWFDIYMRYSYNMDFGIERIINKRMVISLYPGIVIQSGLLSTPFHRVYFINEEGARVENLPTQRIKVPLGIKLNSYIGTSFILNTFYRFYADDFGISSNTFELETYYKINPYLTPSLSLRFYQQTASKYFKPYQEHLTSDTWYTSDYDLSAFYSIRAGAGFRFTPFKKMFSKWSFDVIDLKYTYYWRSDGLDAHIISSYFGIKRR